MASPDNNIPQQTSVTGTTPLWQQNNNGYQFGFKPVETPKMPIFFYVSGEEKTQVQQLYSQWLQQNKAAIGESLSGKNVCVPDALRVDNSAAKIEAEETIHIKPAKKQTPKIQTNYPPSFDVTKNMFKGTAADLDNRLKGTKLEGKGQMFMDAQEKYGINALFLMGIVQGESGYGNAPAVEPNGSVHKYNIAGLKSGKKSPRYINPDSYEDCIASLCKNLHKHYISKGKTTISSIAAIYAPGNKKWAPKTTKAMNDLAAAIVKDYARNPLFS